MTLDFHEQFGFLINWADLSSTLLKRIAFPSITIAVASWERSENVRSALRCQENLELRLPSSYRKVKLLLRVCTHSEALRNEPGFCSLLHWKPSSGSIYRFTNRITCLQNYCFLFFYVVTVCGRSPFQRQLPSRNEFSLSIGNHTHACRYQTQWQLILQRVISGMQWFKSIMRHRGFHNEACLSVLFCIAYSNCSTNPDADQTFENWTCETRSCLISQFLLQTLFLWAFIAS